MFEKLSNTDLLIIVLALIAIYLYVKVNNKKKHLDNLRISRELFTQTLNSENTEAANENTEAVKENTEAVNENTEAVKKNTEASRSG